MKKIWLILVFVLSLHGAQNGVLSFFILKDQKPLAKGEVVVYKKEQEKLVKKADLITDVDGFATKELEEGAYQLHVVAKDGATPLVFARKNFIIQAQKESQVILLLDSNNTLSLSDVEAPQIKKEAPKKETQKQEKGSLELTLLSSEGKKSVEGARIFVKGSDFDLLSDKSGKVQLALGTGEHVISVIHNEYSSQNVVVTIAANETTTKTVELSPASMELDEFVVLAPKIEGSIASVMAEEKNANSIANVVGSEQMSKQGDSNAASALKRVAGITLIGGKYVYVRGLGDRYSATELNGMSLPSPNPIKRTVPLDMFPSGVIGTLQVQKSPSPDITGAFGGGYVNIRTKNSKEEDYAKVGLGVEAHSNAGKEVTSYKGGSSDWTGYDDSYRPFTSELTSNMAVQLGEERPTISGISNEEMQAYTTKREYNKEKISLPYGKSVDLEVSKNFTLGKEHEFSVLANYGYKSSAESREYTEYDYLISSSGVLDPDPDNNATNNLSKISIQHGGMVNLAYKYRDFETKYTKLYVLNTLDQTRDILGTFGENNSAEQQNYLEWQERELSIDQINSALDYHLLLDNRVEFGIESAAASEYVPNDVFYYYKQLTPTTPYVFAKYQSELTFSNRNTQDDVLSAYVKNKTTTPLLSDEDFIEVGASLEEKERIGRVNTLRIQSKINDTEFAANEIDEILSYEDPTKLKYNLTSRPKDNYDASLKRSAFFVNSTISPVEELFVTFGARKESLRQEAQQFDIEDNIVISNSNVLEFDKLLPSASIKYAINEHHQVKLAYGETFVYPDFREFIDSEFIHPEFVAKIAGNPDLVETDVKSYDLQYGYYFDDIDNITFSLFYKDLKNPIEDVRTFTTSTLDRFSFENSAAAKLSGIELSWYKNLGFISEKLENIIFSGNYTTIQSEVTLTPEQKEKYVTQERGLQGLSPEVINLSLTYQNDDRSINLSYNKMAERLMRVALKNGTVILGLDEYEVPPELLDFTWIEKFKSEMIDSDMSLVIKIKNLLDSETLWQQEGQTTLRYKTGQTYSVGVSAKF